MIRISTFYLLNNFARINYKFYDDKMIVKIKSLNVESEREIKYEKIKAIQHSKKVDLRWLWTAFTLIAMVSALILIRYLTQLRAFGNSK